MKRWLLILLLSSLGYVNASLQNTSITKPYQTKITNQKEAALEDLQITITGYNFLKSKNIESVNIPNGCPLDLNGFTRISDYFGMRYHPIRKTRRMHYGIDLAGVKGTKIFATGNGVIARSTYLPGYGSMIEIDHGDGIRTIYAHLSKRKVRKGQVVLKGENIGYLGNTGASTGPHLHYEVRIGSERINPLRLYSESIDISENTIINLLKNRYNEQQGTNYYSSTEEFNKSKS